MCIDRRLSLSDDVRQLQHLILLVFLQPSYYYDNQRVENFLGEDS